MSSDQARITQWTSLKVPTSLEQSDWDFAKCDTKYATHGLHVYPARMIPQIAERLINMYSSPRDTVLDPFCGSGGVLVESRLHGRHSYGVDLNPFACFLAKVKTRPTDPKILRNCWKEILPKIRTDIDNVKKGKLTPEIPVFPKKSNIEHWFKDYVIKELSVVRQHILGIEDRDIRDFFSVAFSATVRDVSNMRSGEYKLYIMSPEQLKRHKPEVLKKLISNVKNSIACIREFWAKCDRETSSSVMFSDTRYLPLDDESVDLIVTSPPYGDSQTTVGYGQFSKYPMLWLGIERMNGYRVDNVCLGGCKNQTRNLNSETLTETIEEISKRETRFINKRAIVVLNFFADLDQCLDQISRVLREGKWCCFVLGNRSVRGVRVRIDKIIAELGMEKGLEHIQTIHRNIPTKRHPRRQRILIEQAPSLSQQDAKTMWIDNILTENIVTLRK